MNDQDEMDMLRNEDYDEYIEKYVKVKLQDHQMSLD